VRDTLPDFADVTITTEDFTRAVPFRTSQNSCGDCIVAQAFKRTFRAAAAVVGYDGANVCHCPPPPPSGNRLLAEWAYYKWNDRRMSSVIVAFDAGDDRKLAALLPLTIHVQRVR
jgi:hypothetical protein